MAVAETEEVPLAPASFSEFARLESPARRSEVERWAEAARSLFAGRVIWNVNSTAAGGGVAEMLRSLLAYARGFGVDARWLVIKGDADFFRVTKRLHNHLHGDAGDSPNLGEPERLIYERSLEPQAAELAELVKPQDLVLLHDPQTAGLIPALKRHGHTVVWRCHIGIDDPNQIARAAWRFLLEYVRAADAYVFTRQSFVWEGLEPARTWIIPPSIDAFSAKNRDLEPERVEAILGAAGVAGDVAAATFPRQDGSAAAVRHRARMIEDARLGLSDQLVVQVSRWDRLKDPVGVVRGFAQAIAPTTDGHLVVAGPDVAAVVDDPEGRRVLDDTIRARAELPAPVRARIHLACLPMVDGEENAAIVNALQRHALVVVQKSIAEGFGLTVAEAMWKAKPVVASRVGGIQDQIEDGRNGLLVNDPLDLREFGEKVSGLLANRDEARRMGEEARTRIREMFLADRHLIQYGQLFSTLL